MTSELKSQEKASEYLYAAALGLSPAQICAETGLDDVTVALREADPEWQGLVEDHRDSLLGRAHAAFRVRIGVLVDKAWQSVEDLVESDDERIKLGAVRLIFTHAHQLFDGLSLPDGDTDSESNVDELGNQQLTFDDVIEELARAEAERDASEATEEETKPTSAPSSS